MHLFAVVVILDFTKRRERRRGEGTEERLGEVQT